MRSALCLLLLVAAGRALASGEAAVPPEKAPYQNRSGTAVIMTGAAARIPQEAALLEALDKRGMLKDLVFVSGVSSGALNSVALNAVKGGRMTWRRYREILSGLKNEDIFVQKARRIPVDTSPARALYARIVEGEMGYRRIGDLPFATSISITRLEDLGLENTAFRMCSRKINAESDPSLGLVDILMASSAFPVLFPSAKIRGAVTIPDVEYVDGGAGQDFLPYEALLEFERYRGEGVEKVFIISRKSDAAPMISEELLNLGVNDHRIFDRLGISFDAIASRKLTSRLKSYAQRAPELVSRSYVWKPDFAGSFLLFDFGSLELQYAATEAWAAHNAPVLLDLYLTEHEKK